MPSKPWHRALSNEPVRDKLCTYENMHRHYYLRSLGEVEGSSACAAAYRRAALELQPLNRQGCCEELQATQASEDALPVGVGGHDALTVF